VLCVVSRLKSRKRRIQGASRDACAVQGPPKCSLNYKALARDLICVMCAHAAVRLGATASPARPGRTCGNIPRGKSLERVPGSARARVRAQLSFLPFLSGLMCSLGNRPTWVACALLRFRGQSTRLESSHTPACVGQNDHGALPYGACTPDENMRTRHAR